MKSYPQLDGIRGIAILIVIVGHFWVRNYLIAGLGVNLFFVLSGFLITERLLAHRALPLGAALKTFYVRRFLRIFPLYYLVLAVLFAANTPGLRANIAWPLLYSTNFGFSLHKLPLVFSEYLGHLWSLAVEEQFYLVWPFLVLIIKRPYLRRAVLLCVAGAIVFRVSYMLVFHHTNLETFALPFTAMETLALGALLSLRFEQDWQGVKLLGFLAVVPSVGLIIAVHRSSESPYLALQTAVSLVSAACVGAAVRTVPGMIGQVLSSRVLGYLGRISYCLYLVHWPLYQYVGRGWLASMLSLALAALSWRYFESPINSLKHLYRPASSYDAPADTALKPPPVAETLESMTTIS